ncbi:MAG: FAD-dependent oxidoreductase [Clostridia bacterium]|nr:FAD-dependent oxidoreductase [Clostridia bacterium]
MKKLLVLFLCLILALPFCSATAEGTLTDGTYAASANGMDGAVSIEVTITGNVITDIVIIDDNETAGVGDKALEILPAAVIEAQSLAVDNVSGATISSMAIKSAIADAITQAGGDAAEWRKREVIIEKKDETLDYDVVVVGAGLAGLTAALCAEQAGAKVALLEKQGIVGGTSIFSSGNFLAAGTDELIPDVVKAWDKRNKLQEVNKVNIDLVEKLLSVSPTVLKMYEDVGVEFTYNDETYTASPVPSEKADKNAATIEMVDVKVKSKGGEALIASLTKRLQDDGVDLYLSTPATALLTDDAGAVVGVVSESEKTGTKTFNAKAVILCTGDYARDNDLNAELAPETVGEYTATAVSNKGDGLRMAREVGAGLHAYQESLSGNFNADPFDMPVVGQPNNQFPFSILLVDRNGERKVSEAAGPHDQQVFFIYEDAPDHAWAIFDASVAEKFLNLDTYLEKTAAGSPFIQAYEADSIEALAEQIGIDAATLTATVDAYNALCEAGEDTQFGKDAQYLDPITEGKFYAVKEYDMTRGNYGGILTNENFEVVTEAGKVIPGLYATGIISSGDYFGDYYPGREALSLCAHGGYIAGTNAANATKH